MDGRIKALLEVTIVFIVVSIALKLIMASPANIWLLGSYTKVVIFYLVATAIILAILVVTKRDFSRYGISLRNAGNDMKVVMISAIPMLVISAAVILIFLRWRTIGGALLVSAVEVIILFALGKLLMNVPGGGDRDHNAMVGLLLLAPALTLSMVGDFATTLLFLFIFVGPVEELMFRGYFQSRINEAFGRPYRFFGVSYGVGIFVSALLFGLWHMLGVFNPLVGMYYFDLPWGLWIFFNGLVFGFIREKTGSLVAPSILHALYDLPIG